MSSNAVITGRPELDEAVRIYGQLMEEIKTRLTAVKETADFLHANRDTPNSFFHAEFAYLQLRFVCELVALSALAAHKPYGLTDQLWESYHARRALQQLAAINKACFPRPISLSRTDVGVHITLNEAGALKRAGLQRIYDKLGSTLHRGRFRHVFERQPRVYDMGAIDRWGARIGALLSHHIVMIPDQGISLVVQMSSGPENGVQIAIAEANGPAVYKPPSPPAATNAPRRAKKAARPRATKGKTTRKE